MSAASAGEHYGTGIPVHMPLAAMRSTSKQRMPVQAIRHAVVPTQQLNFTVALTF